MSNQLIQYYTVVKNMVLNRLKPVFLDVKIGSTSTKQWMNIVYINKNAKKGHKQLHLFGCVLWHISTCRLFKPKSFIYIYIYIYENHHHHQQVMLLAWIPWLSIAISPNHPSLLAGFPDYILCQYRVVVGWSANTGASMWRGLLENVTYEFILASLAVPHISYSLFIWIVLEISGKWPYS